MWRTGCKQHQSRSGCPSLQFHGCPFLRRCLRHRRIVEGLTNAMIGTGPANSERPENRAERDHGNERDDRANDDGHDNVEIALAVRRPAYREQGYDRAVLRQAVERAGAHHGYAVQERAVAVGAYRRPSHTRARAGCACPSARRPPHSRPMAGSPLKRARKQGVRLEDGRVITFPYMPRVPDLPPGWRHWSPAEKIEHLLGMSLDRCYEILSWPMTELDPLRLCVDAGVAGRLRDRHQ